MYTLSIVRDIIKDIGTPVVALISAIAALLVYRHNARTRRAEFLSDLHTSFSLTTHINLFGKLLIILRKALLLTG